MPDELQQAVEALARLAVERRHQPEWVKRADGLADVLTAVGQNPALSHTLAGGALGAGAGAFGTFLGNRERDPRERRSLWGGALTGGLAGAALGGGVGLARQGVAGLNRPAPDTSLADKVRELSAGPPLSEKATREVMLSPFGFAAAHPGVVGSGVAAAGWDWARHNPNLRMGERLGWGAISPENSTNMSHFLGGVEASKAKDSPIFGGGDAAASKRSLLNYLSSHDPETLKGINRNPAGGYIGGNPAMGVDPAVITAPDIGKLRTTGAQAAADAVREGQLTKGMAHVDPRTYRLPPWLRFGGERDVLRQGKFPTHASRLAPWVGAVLGIPAATWLAGSYLGEHQKQQDLAELLRQNAGGPR